MIFTAMLGVVSFAEAETPEEPKELVISSASLEFADNVYLLIAVDYSAVGSADGITLKIKNNKTGEEATIDTPATDITAPTGCVAFKHVEIGAKNMGDELSIQAYLNGSESGDPITYSILEYALRAESLANEKLTALVKSMIKYGAEAQKAWSHEGTYDLTKDYGLVIVGGATKETRKTLAEVGTAVSPVMNAEAFPAGAELYGIDFEKADSVKVTEGVSRYYYFGTDIYGDKNGDATTTIDNVATDVDFDKYTGNPTTYLYDKDNTMSDLDSKYKGCNLLVFSGTTAIAFNRGGLSGWSYKNNKANNSVFKIYSNTAKANVTADSNYKGGKLYIENGYLLVDCYSEYFDENGDRYPTVGYQLQENHDHLNPYPVVMHDPSNFLKDGKFTIGFSLAKKADVPFVTGSTCYIGTNDSKGSSPLFTSDGENLKYNNTVIVNLKEFTGDAPTKSDYTTFYMVFDTRTNTVTVHRDDGVSITLPVTFSKNDVTDMAAWLADSDKQNFTWNIPGSSGEAYINRITYMVGDIFA